MVINTVLSAMLMMSSVAESTSSISFNQNMLRVRFPHTAEAAARTRRAYCITPPCAASLRGDVALTTVTGSIVDGGSMFKTDFEENENVYGPFEAGFTTIQDQNLRGFGCSTPSDGYMKGGIDTRTAQEIIAKNCSVTLPRVENGTWIGMLDSCGGHTNDYHFHEELKCLWEGKYDLEDGVHHSIRIGKVVDSTGTVVRFYNQLDQYLYGMYEDEKKDEAPLLDACGGHFGVTPDSFGEEVYHYHLQDKPPFTIGCIGPSATGGMVTLDECRALYSECGNGDTEWLNTASKGLHEYDLDCPCFDGKGSNVGTEPLPYAKLLTFPTVFGYQETTSSCSGNLVTEAECRQAASSAGWPMVMVYTGEKSRGCSYKYGIVYYTYTSNLSLTTFCQTSSLSTCICKSDQSGTTVKSTVTLTSSADVEGTRLIMIIVVASVLGLICTITGFYCCCMSCRDCLFNKAANSMGGLESTVANNVVDNTAFGV